MPADNELDPLDRWLNQQVQPLPPPPGTFELISKRARRRRIRRTVASVASVGVVAAAIAVAVPLSMSLHLTTTPANGTLAGAAPTSPSVPGSQSPLASASTALTSPVASATAAKPTGGYLPPNLQPTSVTWDSASTGWVLGPAGTPGQCDNANPDVCTSVARTADGGRTWHGLPAPSTTDVTGLRFLNATYGWAFGPQLWATDDGGEQWHQVNTGGLAVTDLETLDGRAFALFASCAALPADAGPDLGDCTSYTLETASAGSDDWTPVSGVPASLSSGASPGGALIELSGAEQAPQATRAPQATGYLIAPDGTLYAGPVSGGAWHSVSTVPCAPSLVPGRVQPQDVMLAPMDTGFSSTASSTTGSLALVCSLPDDPKGFATVAYVSTDGGKTWTKQAAVGTSGTSWLGQARSLTAIATGSGTLVLATSSGIYRLPLGATRWQRASLQGAAAPADGFSYVGMTTPTQGVALGSPAQNEVWMTTDGGKTWQPRKIQS